VDEVNNAINAKARKTVSDPLPTGIPSPKKASRLYRGFTFQVKGSGRRTLPGLSPHRPGRPNRLLQIAFAFRNAPAQTSFAIDHTIPIRNSSGIQEFED
jgi:hypothetical protein